MKKIISILILLPTILLGQSFVSSGIEMIHISTNTLFYSKNGVQLKGASTNTLSLPQTFSFGYTSSADSRVLMSNSDVTYQVRDVANGQTAIFNSDTPYFSGRTLAQMSIVNESETGDFNLRVSQNSHEGFNDIPLEWIISKSNLNSGNSQNLSFTWQTEIESTAIPNKSLFFYNIISNEWQQLSKWNTIVDEEANTLFYNGFQGSLDNQRFMIAEGMQPGTGDLVIVETGGDAINSSWTFNNGVLSTISSSATVNASIIENYLITGDLILEADNITFSASINNTTANAFIVLANTNILNTTATTITSQGGDVIFSADADGTGGGSINLHSDISVTTNDGDITFAGGDATGSGFAQGWGTGSYEGGIDIRGTLDLQSGGGDITFRGKSDVGAGSTNEMWGIGLWTTTNKTINAGSGQVYMEGISNGTTTTNKYNYGVAWQGSTVNITSSKTSGDAIIIKGSNVSLEAGGDGRGLYWQASNSQLYATGSGGNIVLEADGYYGFTLYNNIEVLAASGDINILTTVDKDATDIYLGGSTNVWWGSKAGTPVTTSSSNILVRGNEFDFNGNTPDIGTTGTFTLEPVLTSTSFDQAVNTNYFTWNANSQTLGGLTYGKLGNTANITISDAQNVTGGISIYGGNISVNQNLTSTGAGADVLLKGFGDITLAASRAITTNGGDVILWANSDGATSAGSVFLRNGSSISTSGGNVWAGGGSGTTTWNSLSVGDGYAVPGTVVTPSNGGSNITAGIYLENFTITTDGGNVLMKGDGQSTSRGIITYGANTITADTGTINFEGIVSGATNNPGILFGIHDISRASNVTITSSATGDAIVITGTGKGSGGGVELSGTMTLESTGSGNISINGSGGSTGYGIEVGNYYHGILNVYAASGDIRLDGGTRGVRVSPAQLGGQTTGPSKLNVGQGGNVASSGSDFYIIGDVFSVGTTNGFAANTTGKATIAPYNASFTSALSFPIANVILGASITGLTLGKEGNTANITINSATSIAGPISVYGGIVNVNGNLTSSANGDIFLKGISGANGDVFISSGRSITKSAGTGTLTIQGHGRINNAGTITTSGTGVLNVVMWSDYDDDNDDGGTSHTGTISTGGGHVWMGGSSTTGGSMIWNGLTVGDGPSIGSFDRNFNALDLYGSVTTNDGDFLAWAGDGYSNGVDGIASNGGAYNVNVGSGDIILITDQVNGTGVSSIVFTTTGIFTLAPNDGSFSSPFNWNPGVSGAHFDFPSGVFNYLRINNVATIGGLTIGQYTGTGLPGDTTFYVNNSSDVTISTATAIAGPISVYGGSIAVNANLNSTGGGVDGDIMIKANNNITQANNVDITTDGGDVIYWADSDEDNNGNIAFGTSGGQDIVTNGGDIYLAGGAGSTVPTGLAQSSSGTGILLNAPNNTTRIVFDTRNSTDTAGNIIIRGKSTGAYDGVYTENAQFFGHDIILEGETGNSQRFAVRLGSSNVYDGSNLSQVIDADNDLTITAVNTAANYAGNAIRTGFNPRLYADGNFTLNTSGVLSYTSQQSFINVNPGKTLSVNFDGTADFTTSLGNPSPSTPQGSLVIQSYQQDSFTSGFNSSTWSFNNNLSALTIGKPSNTSNITIANTTTIAGPITAYGGDISINSALTATNSTVSIQATGSVTQTAAITATNLDLSGSGTFTLNNTSNNVGTIAGGTTSSKLGALSYTDSNELTIGTLTNPGIVASGKVNVQTLSGNLNLNTNVATDNTETDAIILNAGKSSTIGTTTGGDIIVNGAPSVTTGTNGIAKLFSGSNENSTGLTSLVGGYANIRYESDETTSTFIPALETGNSYALYREATSIAPVITSFTPTIAGKGETVLITGSGFTGVTSVLFGNQAASSFVVNSDTQISAIVDNGASGSVTVSNSAGSNAKSGFIFKVVEYNFENTTLDSTGANLDASLVGTASYSSGASGQAICFDNTYTNGTTVANYLTLPSNLIRGQGTDFTISLRFKTATRGALLGYQNKDVGNTLIPGNWIPLLYVREDGKIAATIWLGGTALDAVSSTVINDNNWHKVDMSISSGAISIYVDNVLEATSTGNITHLDMSFNQLGAAAVLSYFGRTGNWEGFTGCIDDFMILDRALTSNELQQVTATLPPTASNQSVCTGATVSDLVATGQDLKWYTALEGGQALDSTTSVVAGTYYVSQTISGSESERIVVEVSILSNVGWLSPITGSGSLSSESTTATYSVTPVVGATSYVWSLPPGMTITSSTGNEIQVSVSSTFVSGTVSVKALNACSESSVHVLSVSKQNSVLSITGASIVCIFQGSVVESYSVPTIEGATSYVWTVPSGSFISSGENTNSVSITYNASFTRGTIRVSAIGANGVISSGSLSIGGLELPGVITGSTQICSAGTYEYSISPVESATSYEWVLPSGMILQGDGTGTNISVVTSSSVNGTILVRALSSCGSSQPRTLSISGVPTPGYIYGERVICGATSNAVDLNGNVNTTAQSGIYTYSILPVIGADSYTWTLPTGVNLISGQGTRIIQVSFESSFESGNIRVVSNSTSCGTSSPRSVFVSSVSSSLTGPVTICGLNTATYSVAAGSGSDFVWSLPQGMSIISGEGSNSISVSINNPINFINNNQVTVSFTTPCGGTRVVSLIVDCPDYSNLTNCGSTVAFNERVFTRSIRGASMYAFDIYDSNDVLLTTYQTRGNFFQFVQALPSFVFGSTYNVQVRVQRNGVYEDAGTSCSVTIATPTTTIQSSQCNGTILLQDRVYVTSVWDGVTYAFDIYDEQGDFITTLEKSSNFFRLSEFASVYGMTYQIGVRVKRGNGSYGAQGSRCNLTLSIPTTSLAANQCGTTINIADRIYARSVLNATMYAFRIYDANGIFITELERPYNFFRITDITYTAGATYQVGVKVKQGEGNYGLEGSLCSIILNGPATTALESSQCGTSMLYTDLIYATSVSDANGYRFNVYNVAGSTLVASIESATNSFSFSQLTGYTFDTSYQIRVQVLRGTEFGVEGTPCTVTILKENPAPTRAVVVAEPEQTKTNPITELKAYPNPFTSTFQITPIAEETATLFYQVYDVTGKMIESQSVEANNVEYHTIGDMYPVGMYLVIVRQGATTQTFKMVKQ
jgi:hypothetical protein